MPFFLASKNHEIHHTLVKIYSLSLYLVFLGDKTFFIMFTLLISPNLNQGGEVSVTLSLLMAMSIY